MAKAAKYYAVRIGRTPGIYRSWDECKTMVDGYAGAIYKSFKLENDAIAFMKGINNTKKTNTNTKSKEKASIDLPINYAFVDGSFNASTGVYGYGGFLIHNGKKEILQGFGKKPDMASMRNVAGEIYGSIAAVNEALRLGLTEITIYYDYNGIEMWATGQWARNKSGTIAYYDYMQQMKDLINIHFVKVKGHSGVDGNEEADKLAKKAVGII